MRPRPFWRVARLLKPVGLAAVALLYVVDANAQSESSYLLSKVRVTNLERSLYFYTQVLGMKEVRRTDSGPAVSVTLNFGGKRDTYGLVLVNRRENKEPLIIGNGISSFTFAVDDVQAMVNRIASAGYQITQPATEMKNFGLDVTYAFAKDPDGYAVELVHFHK